MHQKVLKSEFLRENLRKIISFEKKKIIPLAVGINRRNPLKRQKSAIFAKKYSIINT